jgi:hypothetical protein
MKEEEVLTAALVDYINAFMSDYTSNVSADELLTKALAVEVHANIKDLKAMVAKDMQTIAETAVENLDITDYGDDIAAICVKKIDAALSVLDIDDYFDMSNYDSDIEEMVDNALNYHFNIDDHFDISNYDSDIVEMVEQDMSQLLGNHFDISDYEDDIMTMVTDNMPAPSESQSGTVTLTITDYERIMRVVDAIEAIGGVKPLDEPPADWDAPDADTVEMEPLLGYQQAQPLKLSSDQPSTVEFAEKGEGGFK